MAAKTNSLSMIGHGTKGSDGIAEGIHLRWSFNDKLGFPPCFKLYRRQSDTKNMYHFPIEHTPIGDRLLPYSVDVIQNENFQYTLESLILEDRDIGYINVESVTMSDGVVLRCLHINEGTLTVLFSKPVSRIEIAFYLEPDSELSVSTIIEEKTSHVHSQSGGKQAWEILSFDAPGTTGLIIEGINIRILAIETWMISKRTPDWVRINQNCGCGLPVNQEGTNYTNEYYQGLMIDLATALCRLGYLRLLDSPITLAEFLELKVLLLSLTEEGLAVPVGWNLFPGSAEEVEEGETAQTVEFSKYDFLLTQSLQVFFAKILGLYFTDTDAVNNQYYDYRITAEWPEWNKRRLDHQFTFSEYEVDDELTTIQQLNDDVVLASPTKSYVVDEVSDEWRTEKGLRVTPTNLPVVINFLKPVTEVQLVIFNPGLTSANPSIEIEAYRNAFGSYVDKEILFLERGMVRLRATQIDYIKIKGGEATLSRIHYDSELYPVGLQEYIIGGLIKRNHIPIQPPRDLTVSFIPGGTISNEDGTLTEKPYLAGIRWDANEDPKADLISIAPVLYHVKRKPHGGGEEWITEEAPLFVAPSEESDQASPPPGWPIQRQYLTDQISLDQVMKYSVAALDLFGRLSEFTPFETYTISPPKAPHPLKVSAKYLDYSCYNPVDHTVSDTTLNSEDKAWLEANGTNAIAVRWEWPLNAQLQAPEVDRFKVYFKPAWLNNFTGMLIGDPVTDTLSKTGLNLTEQERQQFPIFDTSPEELEVYRFEIELHEDRVPPVALPPSLAPVRRSASRRPGIPENIFRLCWMTQGNQSFLVIKNNDEPKPTAWALKLYGIPKAAAGFAIALPPEKEFFIDYREPGNWPVMLHEEPRDGRTSYVVYIENPPFPDPAMKAEDARKVRYAQVGVGSCIDVISGSVSPPATIMAIYHEAPPPPLTFIPNEDDVDALQATRANIHGKSSFALRWDKTSTPVKFHVQRALDETLFKVDHAVRPMRDDSVYDTFMQSHTYFSEANVEAIKIIPQSADLNDVLPQYRNLTPLQLQILASLPDNQKAYTRINEAPIDQSDPVYADRVTEIPDPTNGSTYSPSDDVLLFVDNTLNGQSNNYFFYALKSVDTNGLYSGLSLSTLPVAIPKTTPPPAPVITSITGGERHIAIAWAKNSATAIVGYLVYRTQVKASTKDWRKMELIKTNSSDAFTVRVGENIPGQFVFIDATAIPRQPYYYGVIAVGLSDEGKWLKSKMSNVVVGQGYDLTPPEPPVWDEENSGWVYVDDNDVVYEWDDDLSVALNPMPSIRLLWTNDKASFTTQISKLSDVVSMSVIIKDFTQHVAYDEDKQIFIDRKVSQDKTYQYKGKVQSDAGMISKQDSHLIIFPKSVES